MLKKMRIWWRLAPLRAVLHSQNQTCISVIFKVFPQNVKLRDILAQVVCDKKLRKASLCMNNLLLCSTFYLSNFVNIFVPEGTCIASCVRKQARLPGKMQSSTIGLDISRCS